MSHTKKRVLLSALLALSHLLLFLLYYAVAASSGSDGLVRACGYLTDLMLAVVLAAVGGILLHDLSREGWVERYLLSALPFLARLFYYAPYYTLDYTLNESIETAIALPLAVLQAFLESALWYGALLLIFFLYRRVTARNADDETAALIVVALPLVQRLIEVLVSLCLALVGGRVFGGILASYALEVGLILLGAVLSYPTVRYCQRKL